MHPLDDPSDVRLYWAFGLFLFSLLGRPLILLLTGRSGGMASSGRRESVAEPGAEGARLRLEVEGPSEGPSEGPILLLTHGWGQSSRIWADTGRPWPRNSAWSPGIGPGAAAQLRRLTGAGQGFTSPGRAMRASALSLAFVSAACRCQHHRVCERRIEWTVGKGECSPSRCLRMLGRPPPLIWRCSPSTGSPH